MLLKQHNEQNGLLIGLVWTSKANFLMLCCCVTDVTQLFSYTDL